MFSNILRNVVRQFSGVSDISKLASIDMVRAHVPNDTLYVTIASTLVLEPSSNLLKLVHQNFVPVTALADGEERPMIVTYMLHNGTTLKLISQEGEVFSTSLTNVETLHRFGDGGFVLHLRNGQGIASSTPTPVNTDPDMRFRTIQGITDATGGWVKELAPYGVSTFD